ncbi:hypothetical protein MZB69_22240 [Escherichia coli]|nr:hypothetical protein [Escherichia coli]MCQ5518026.1 hypothetical protein [Escherichia coli]MCQ5553214.1 hypothetical protein [Escherichia coli]MCQ5564477.1 hypothetical protein [Escherichia coli]MCQ5584694.1 hypothetical protein [Escherichia coli]
MPKRKIEDIEREILILRCNLIQLASECIKSNPYLNTSIYTDLIYRSADVIRRIEQGQFQNKTQFLKSDINHTLVLYDLYRPDFEKCPSWRLNGLNKQQLRHLKSELEINHTPLIPT